MEANSATAKRIKLLIVDDDRRFVEIVRQYFSSLPEYEIADCVYNGKDAIKAIAEKEPDAVILDLVMPYYDGYEVLDKLFTLGLKKKPYVILLSALPPASAMAQSAMENGRVYYMIKPVELDIVSKRILQAVNFEKENIREKTDYSAHISVVLKHMGMPMHVKGYLYILDAIRHIDEDKSILQALNKELYPAVAQKYAVSPDSVERAIRTAITAAWEHDGGKAMRSVFLAQGVELKEKPTNAEFLAFLAALDY